MKLSTNLLAFSAMMVGSSAAFNVAKFCEPNQMPIRKVNEAHLRHEATTAVDKYTDQDRSSWAFPEESLIRQNNELTVMEAKDRTWRAPKPNMVRGKHGQEKYTPIDRMEWAKPDAHQLRHSNEVASLSTEDKKWRIAQSDALRQFMVGKLSEPNQTPVRQTNQNHLRDTNIVGEYTNQDRALWTIPQASLLRQSNEVARMEDKDRMWRAPKPNMIRSVHARDEYTPEDRKKWAMPKANQLRQSDKLDLMSAEDRKWRMPSSETLLQP